MQKYKISLREEEKMSKSRKKRQNNLQYKEKGVPLHCQNKNIAEWSSGSSLGS